MTIVIGDKFRNNERGMKKVWFLIASFLIIGVLPVGIYLVSTRQEIRNKAAPATTLFITPVSLTKNIGDTFSLEVNIDTGENQIVAAELHLTYDPTKLEVQSVTNGPLFPNILSSGTIENGAVSIAVGAADTKQPITGTGAVAIIKIKALATTDGPSSIKFSPNTFVGGLGEGANNVLVGSTPSTVTVTEAQLQVTPSPTLTLSPTPISTSSAQSPSPASQSASLAIIFPTNEGAATADTPTIRGVAAPGATITLTIYSTPRTVTVTADADGNWAYTPDTALEAGPHNIVASVSDQTGQTETATAAFVVASSGNEIGGGESVIPVSGNVEMTIVLLLIGSLFVGIGIIRPSLLLKP